MNGVRHRLLRSSMFAAAAPLAALAAIASPLAAGAQTASNPSSSSSSSATASATVSEVVVTGSILHHRNAESISPLTVVTNTALQARGITTLDQAVQNLAGNNSGALPNSFTANGAFAAGASGASLRGLTTNSTLVLFDGLRAAYYPLADDGTRNFVDLNTIPNVIVDRVEVLQDGASSTYGADAIAGVVNIITKKQYQGVQLTAEGGFGQYAGGAEAHVSLLAGHGDLGADGYNYYIGVEFQHDDAILNRQRPFPYNTANLTPICGPAIGGGVTCDTNSVVNGLQFDNSFQGVGSTTVPTVIQADSNGNAIPTATWQLLNPAAGCRNLTPIVITPAEAAAGGAGFINMPTTLCQQDLVNQYSVIAPADTRFSVSGRFTKNFGDQQLYLEANYYQNDVSFINPPSSIRQQATPGANGTAYDTTHLTLPVYICPTGIGCSAANGTLNPNNPFAAQGIPALIRYRFGDIPAYNDTFSQVYRLAGGLSGSFLSDWKYNVNGVLMENDLDYTQAGDIYIANLLQAVATGAYNFVDPSANSQAIRNFIAPPNEQFSKSKLAQIQAELSRDIFTLPGGPLQVGVGATMRYESIYNPSANNDLNGPTQRWFTINPFGVIGSRNVEAAYFEVDAPIVHQVDLNVSGRYDHYSTGQSAFSPKYAIKFRPIDQVTLRATYSDGFRIPSLAESNELPTTGFVTLNAPTAFQMLHHNDGYGVGYSLGTTTAGTPGLQPEHSRNITAGIVFQPRPNISVTIDYYNIRKTGVIAAADYTPALNAYFAGQPIPAGFKVTPGLPDPNYPALMPLPGFIQFGFANLNALKTSGFDFSVQAKYQLPFNVTWTTDFEGTYVNNYDLYLPDGTVERFAGTIGPYNTTSASGTPQYRANWENTLDFGRESLSLTVYYTSGYGEAAADISGDPGNCEYSAKFYGVPATYVDGVTPIVCRVKPFVDVELHGSHQLNKRVQLFFDIDNLFNTQAPFDPTTYGGYQYNPAWANSGIVGRYFKIGAKATF